jgi:outer membrane protein assembly factor BamB
VAVAAPALGAKVLTFGASQPAQVTWIDLVGPPVAVPARCGSRLLVPLENGAAYLLDVATGQPAAEPFLPRLEGGATPAWRTPVGLSENEAVLVDAVGRLYRLNVEQQPQPHLAAAAESSAPAAIAAGPAVAGDSVFVVLENQRVLAYRLPGLNAGQEFSLTGNVVWGPVAAGDAVLLATDDRQLWCAAAEGKRWNVPLPFGQPVGQPLVQGGSVTVAANDGRVWTLDAATGEPRASCDLGQSLAAGPIQAGARWLLAAQDGALLVLDPGELRPLESSGASP